MGNKVHIRTTPDVTVKPYTKGMGLTHEHLVPTDVELDIDQGSWWDFSIDDVDRFQADIAYMEKWTQDASMQQKIYVDTLVLANTYSSAAATNKGSAAGAKSADINLGKATSPVSLTKSNVLDFIVDCGTVLDETNTPDEDRWMVLPMWAIGKIKKSDIKDASLTGDGTSVLRNGRIGIVDRFTIYGSNLVYQTTDTVKVWHAMCGHRSAITFASQFIKNQVLDKVESTFAAVCRGLQVFGYKVLKDEQLCDLYIAKGSN